MRRSALLVAIFWWVQGPLCLLPLASSHAHGPEATQASAHHEHAPSPPNSNHQHDPSTDDSGCAEHCASLSRALSPVTPQESAAPSLWIPVPAASLFLGEIPRFASPSGLARERPPPDLLLRNATLRI